MTRPLRPAILRTALITLGAALGLALRVDPTLAADHREAPLIQEDGAADINDVYAFRKPGDSSKLILAMTVNPFSVPAEAVTYNFSEDVAYQLHVDTAGDGRADETLTFQFRSDGQGGQIFFAWLPGRNFVSGPVTAPTENPDPNPALITDGPDGIRVFAGPRDDPFFFDVVGVLRFLDPNSNLGPTGTDGFAGFNVSAIVVEVPISLVAGDATTIGVWGTTLRQRIELRKTNKSPLHSRRHRWHANIQQTLGRFQQIERMGNPGVATVLIPRDLDDLYNASLPRNDARDFLPVLAESLGALGTNETNTGILASVAVPDTLKLDLTQASGFPNGRALGDDVIDTLLTLLTNGAVTGDGVDGNDAPFLAEFPFLGEPQQAP